MGNFIFALALIGLVVEIIAYCLGRESMFGKARIEGKVDKDDDLQYVFDSRKKFSELTGTLTVNLTIASDSLNNAKISRQAAESSIRHVEMLLVEQDKLGFVTSGSELDVILRRQFMDRDEESFIKSQQAVHAHVEKVRDCVFDMQRLSKCLSDWMPGRKTYIQDACDELIIDLERDAKKYWTLTDSMLAEADRDPVGIDDERATPKVLEFRQELQKFRSHIRKKLAAKT